jgi:hypothetical protein
MQLAVRFEDLLGVEVCGLVSSMSGPQIQDEVQHLLQEEFWIHLK